MRGVGGGGARKGKRYKGSKKDRCTATLRTRIRRGGSEEGIGNTEEVEKPFVPRDPSGSQNRSSRVICFTISYQ